MRRALIVALACLAAACHSASESPPEPPRAVVRCAPVEARAWIEQRALRGTVSTRPDRDALLSAQVPGRLLRVDVREGDAVEAGQVVAEVESGPLRDGVRQAQALLGAAEAQRAAATAEVAREQHLFERGISARQTLEAAQATLGQAEGSAALAVAQLDLARQSLARARIHAPIRGVVVRLFRREGEVVDGTPATPILEVADPSALELTASVPARDLLVIAPGQRAQVTLEPLPERPLSASVAAISPAVDATSGVGTVRLALEASGLRIPIGVVGVASVQVSGEETADVVPLEAIRNAGGTNTEIVLCERGHARPIPVVVGERRATLARITSGLEGISRPARVVVAGLVGLEDGTAIEEAR